MSNFIVHYSEIALKGGNRRFFVNKLVENIQQALGGLGSFSVKKLPGRIFISSEDVSISDIEDRLSKIPGIANFMLVFQVDLTGKAEKDVKSLKDRLGQELDREKIFFEGKSFRVTTQRADKSFALTSEDVNRELGAFVVQKIGNKVDLKNPEITIFVWILNDRIVFSFDKKKGSNGLPVGASGKLVSLLSGGIDSPVASYMMMKRGCEIVFAHFHSFPYLDYSSCDKAIELVKLLDKYQPNSKLYLLPFGDTQKEVMLKVPDKYRVVIYRRLMVRIAEKISEKENAGGLVTGESLGQVASQTLENMSVVNRAASVPIMRPLVGMNKEEIIKVAKDVDAYDISILHDQDCCQLFMPKHPATKSRLSDIEEIEKDLDIDGFVEDVLQGAEVKKI